MPSAAAEIALARTAGPSSISAHAEVLVLANQGYVVGAKGTNGWLCLVGRSWTAVLDDPEFWNWRGLGPACLNPPAVRSVLPQYLARTKWAIAGDTREEIAAKAKAAYADHLFTDPAPASFAFMLSKEGYLLASTDRGARMSCRSSRTTNWPRGAWASRGRQSSGPRRDPRFARTSR